jgi:hypothetical protein
MTPPVSESGEHGPAAQVPRQWPIFLPKGWAGDDHRAQGFDSTLVAEIHADIIAAGADTAAQRCALDRMVELARGGEAEAAWYMGAKCEMGSKQLRIIPNTDKARDWYLLSLQWIRGRTVDALRRTHGRALSGLAGVTECPLQRDLLLDHAVSLCDSRALAWGRRDSEPREPRMRPQLSSAASDLWDFWHCHGILGGPQMRVSMMPHHDKLSLWLWQLRRAKSGNPLPVPYLRKEPSP